MIRCDQIVNAVDGNSLFVYEFVAIEGYKSQNVRLDEPMPFAIYPMFDISGTWEFPVVGISGRPAI
jgi:hypothetical protein